MRLCVQDTCFLSEDLVTREYSFRVTVFNQAKTVENHDRRLRNSNFCFFWCVNAILFWRLLSLVIKDYLLKPLSLIELKLCKTISPAQRTNVPLISLRKCVFVVEALASYDPKFLWESVSPIEVKLYGINSRGLNFWISAYFNAKMRICVFGHWFFAAIMRDQ